MATSFDGCSHRQLRAMTTSLEPEAVQARADQLKKAAEDIAKIAEKLKRHRVTGWEGEGAVAFQEWVGRAGNATLRLSEYSKTGSEWMGRTVQLMYEASKMPVIDAAATANLEAARTYPNDPDAAKIGAEARKKLDSDHREAVRLMNNLAQSYELAAGEMERAEVPTFPPPPKVFVPQGIYGLEEMARPGGHSGSSAYASSAPGGSGSTDESGSIPGRQPQPDNTPPPADGPLPVTPDREVSLDLDTVGTLPPPPTATTPGSPLPAGLGGPHPGPFVPPMPVPPVPGLKGPGPVGLGPVGPISGTTGPPSKTGLVPGIPQRDNGIMGGRPVPSSGPSSGIPRGTVIGEGTHTVRGMGGGTGHGGVVGARPPGAAGHPFTQGGPGFVRNGSGGAGAAPRTAPGNRRDDQRGGRPDYLAEDEETWQGNRRVVPPVID
ncbi:hypothetical protein [Streptomyces sp. NPDC091371]|uniref:WXG100 family type VII secretion target n=1 Tax=Streptomyces sp. NPDC091371 TaxID=3155303 RepID=UPI00342C5119